MSRSFRIYQKKRGNRRTGSGSLAKLGEAIFFGVFFLAGCAGLVTMVATLVLPEWRVNNEFVETTCVVRGKLLAVERRDDAVVYRPLIAIDYRVNGKPCSAKTYDVCGSDSSDRETQQAVIDRFDVGKKYPCWYDPRDPATVVLVRGYRWMTGLLLVIPLSLMLIGGGGFLYRAWHWGKSAEHRAAIGAGPNLLRGAGAGGHDPFPTVPPPGNMTNSPGTTLRFRLPIHRSATAGLFGLAVVCVFWNVVMAFLTLDVVNRFLKGTPNWIETGVVAPLALAGLALVYVFFRQLLIATGIGPTLVEISDLPLYPGGTYDLFASQAGRLRLRSIELSLVATEEVRYRQGTDTRTETRCVHRESLSRRENVEIRGGNPLELRCSLEVPRGIMHSFQSRNNSLSWSLVVEGKAAGWPDYRRAFSIVIFPDGSENHAP
ncbi:MAG TPA: DUF3592 domain-containing protein [Thermoguttaceae bacterium]|nr:DUF3592 domain-containing protein [Thermoguttaceae bacterium]